MMNAFTYAHDGPRNMNNNFAGSERLLVGCWQTASRPQTHRGARRVLICESGLRRFTELTAVEAVARS